MPTGVTCAHAMHAAYTSPASPHTALPRGISMVVIMAAVCAVAGCSDASSALEPLLQRAQGIRW